MKVYLLLNSMPKTIKDIIIPLKNKYGLSGLWSRPTSYMDYEDKTEEVIKDIEWALNYLLEEVEKRLPSKTILDNGFNECLEICNNIISSLRSDK